MESSGNSTLKKQVIIFIAVFVAAFFATKYLAKAFLNTSDNHPAEQSSGKTQTP